MSEAKLMIDGIPFRGKNLVDKKFGRATVLRFERRERVLKNGMVVATKIYWRCACDCGSEFVTHGVRLLSGRTNSCGCYQRMRATQARTVHGGTGGRKGLAHPMHESWRGMKERCSNPNRSGFQRYGGRGIRVCRRWMAFANFRDDMHEEWREGLTIDRIDNDGHYSCGNCHECRENGWPKNARWADWHTQSRNRSDNRWVEFHGERMILTDWAARIGMSSQTLGDKLTSGESLEDIIASSKHQ